MVERQLPNLISRFLPRYEIRLKPLTKAHVSQAFVVICDVSAAENPASELVKWHHNDITMAQRFSEHA
jgi:hypothetical protein